MMPNEIRRQASAPVVVAKDNKQKDKVTPYKKNKTKELILSLNGVPAQQTGRA